MNKLAYFKRFTLALIFAAVGVISWGQAALSGTGTSKDPYLISTVSEWNAFAEAVNGGYSYSGDYVKLTQNLSGVTTMVGVWSETEADRKPFSGTFYGDGKTITVNYANSTSGKYTAPFVCTNGATINRLKVAGNITITNNVGKAAGVIGVNYGSKTKVNGDGTNISVNITNGSNGSAGNYCAGVAVDGRYVEISSCAFSGKIIAGDNSAGFCAIGDENTKLNNSLFVPADGSSITGTNVENFVANGTYNTQYSNKFYYCHDGTVVASTQGTRVYASAASVTEGFYKKTILYDNKYYFVPGTGAITNLTSYYYLRNLKSEETLGYAVTFDGATVDPGNYTGTITNDATSATTTIADIVVGNYTLTVNGDNVSYAGSITAAFEVKADLFSGDGTEESPYEIANTTNWNDLADAVNDGHSFAGDYFLLTADITVSVNNNEESDRMIGEYGYPFSGRLNGKDSNNVTHTLTFNYNKEGSYDYPVAPFTYIENATFTNMTLAGTIQNVYYSAAGLIGVNTGDNPTTVATIINGIIIQCGSEGHEYCGGFAVDGSNVTFTNCVYNGEFYAYDFSGGFCGLGDDNTSFTNCLFNPNSHSYDYAGGTFMFEGVNNENITNSYYTVADYWYSKGMADPNYYEEPDYYLQGTLAYKTEPTDNIATKKTILNTTVYKHVEVDITNFVEKFNYDGTIHAINPNITFDNISVANGDGYTYEVTKKSDLSVHVVQEFGAYTLTIIGKQNNENVEDYYGRYNKDFYVGITGAGTIDEPYIISSAEDWDVFALAVSEGHSFS